MRVSIVAVGKPGMLAVPIAEYEERARRYWRLEATVVRQGRGGRPGEVRAREAALIRARLRPDHVTVALARAGRSFPSVAMARWLEKQTWGPARGVHFLIGGAFGLDAGLLEQCDLTMSLSPFTLPHDLARLVLAEQLYRAGTILRNEPYHKGAG